MITRRSFIGQSATVATVFGFAPGLARAEAGYPSRPVRILVTDPAGAAVDVVTRIFMERLQAILGQPVVVENRAGGTGLIAAQAAVGSTPDGYTLLAAAASTFTVLPVQNQKLAIDVEHVPGADTAPGTDDPSGSDSGSPSGDPTKGTRADRERSEELQKVGLCG